MHTNGYLNARERHPGFLVAAIGINLAAVSAMLAYKAEVFGPGPDAIPTIKIEPPIRVVPPPKSEREPPKPRAGDVRPEIDRPLPPIPIPPIENDRAQWPELPPLPPTGGVGNDGEAVAPRPVPVEVGASLDPRFAANVQPPYPAWLERQEIEGRVTVRVQVGTDGRVVSVELVSASHPDFFGTTRDQALKRWRFKPATRDGVPVTSWVTKTVRFPGAPRLTVHVWIAAGEAPI